MTGILAAPHLPPVDNTWAAPGIAAGVAVVLTAVVFLVVRSARDSARTPDGFLLADRSVPTGQNTLAHLGAFIMYSTVIIIVGHIALNGYDAILMMTAFTIGSVLGVLIYASPMRNVGGHTMGDLFVLRARKRPARIASAVITLTTYTMFMVSMLAAIGQVAIRMFDTGSEPNLAFGGLVVAVVGAVAIAWVHMGGMLGVTRLLALKTVLMGAFVVLLTAAVLVKYKMNILGLLDDAEANAKPDARGFDLLGPGRLFGDGSTPLSDQDPWVHLSKLFCIAVGGMGMPWVFMRFYVATSARNARKAAGWASIVAVGFYQCMAILGLGAVAILGANNFGMRSEHRDITLPKLVDDLGGPWASGVFGGLALISVAGIFAGLLINGVTSFTKDLNAARDRTPQPADELAEIRRNVLVIGAVSIVVGGAMVPLFTHLFIPTAVDLGAATVLPAILYSLYWRRFNTRGLQWTVYGGMAVTLVMVVFSNGVSGDPTTAMFPDLDFKLFDIEPGLLSTPIAFLLGYLGTVSSDERDDAGFAELQVRAFTGITVPAHEDPHADLRDLDGPPTPSAAR
ncbi:Na+:solute symporter [Streptomyces roseirectus]|uniref:Na+:solute symporter n=1 Tax=Streptomyces roseirectus TaxID=2768066 RepID=A0A7H0IPL8_9ACTN|nr:Na+:solute symporter [Streptomyces roseirectus]QNP74734.1 Na+:solute symporter [Streptomyces roseirectus]